MRVVILPERATPYHVGIWHATMCICMPDGHIVRYLRTIESDRTIALPWSDGFLYRSNRENNRHEFEGYGQDTILGVQAVQIIDESHGLQNPLLCLPLDDDIFEFGLEAVLRHRIPNLDLPWQERQSKVFWRGAGPHPLRSKVVEELFDYEHANVLFGRIPGNREEDWSQKYWDPTYEGKWQPIPMSEFVKYKYILIIDNFIITSAYSWIFGTGSVPILVKHPMTRFWYEEYLIPYVNYVPITHPSLGAMNLRETIEFLRDHDDLAQSIAKNALALSRTIFTPEFQRHHIQRKLREL